MELNDSPVQKSAVEIVIQKEKKSLRPVGPQVRHLHYVHTRNHQNPVVYMAF